MADIVDNAYIVVYQSINRLDIDIVTDALQESAIPYSVHHAGRVVGTKIIIPASHKSRVEEILAILPVTPTEGTESSIGKLEPAPKPWVNKVFIVALVYIVILALLYYYLQK